jgi:bifunctional non-homologous end joining protein LigD
MAYAGPVTGPPNPLHAYAAKRDPRRTPEPFGRPRAGGATLFVVQQHGARRLHYDFRLEMGGTLKSWAIPRGPSARPGERRLAVQVEDHPVEYADFEGVIPPGNYGAGPVIVWDRGWYRLVTPGDPLEALARGRLEVELYGYKLRGRWILTRTARGERDWLLVKARDAGASDAEPTERFPESVLSGLTLEEVRHGPRRLGQLRRRLARLGAPRREVRPRAGMLMLATLADRPPTDHGWLFELKYDGVRVLAERRGAEVRLVTRSGQQVTSRYPEVVGALRTVPLDRFLLDGELVALDDTGRPSFQRLQTRMHLTDPGEVAQGRARVPVSGVFFDALALDGRDLRALPLRERKACLALLLPRRGVVSVSAHVAGHGPAFYEAVCEQRLEGVVAKRADSPYTPGRSARWLKIKCQKRQEFVIGGWTEPRGSRPCLGALHLGLWEDGRLVYVGKVGTGFDTSTLASLLERLRPLERPTPPFTGRVPRGRQHHWVEPRLVCEVRFTEWTRDGAVRHPTFLGLRDDKRPEECRRETVSDAGPVGGGAGARRASVAARAPAPPVPRTRVPLPRVTITNPDKVFWPAEGFTKADLVAYYEAVAPWLLPYLRDRPVVLTRYPDGIAGKSFFQKAAPESVPEWVRTVRLPGDGGEREIAYFVLDHVEALRYVINLGTIPLHVWASRVGSLERPDWLVLDLDPKGAPFRHVVAVARTLHALCERLGLPTFIKTSGQTGLHIFLPLGARYTYEQARTFARLLATLGAQALPALATVSRPLSARQGKVYIDWAQNARGQTVAAPFSVRPVPGALVSCPLRWSELTARLDPARFTLATVPRRLPRVGDPMAPVLATSLDLAEALSRLERELDRRRRRSPPC